LSAGQPSALAYRYASALARSGFSADPAQRAAIDELERLHRELIATKKPSLLTRFRRYFSAPLDHAGAVRGVYLWGAVGRGKTWLMDLFFEGLPLTRKRRSHFHRFMQSVHEGLRQHRDEVDPLIAVATDIARDTRVLCLDELFVSDIADAMLLGGLFAHLVDRSVTLVCTSNVPPAGLYRSGLQRRRFLPAITLLERHCALVSVDGGTDYRLRQLTRMPIYLQSDSKRTASALTEIFEDLADGLGKTGGSIDVEGREIEVLRVCDNVVWFDFRALCEGPRSQNDYVSIAREFQTVLLSNVPVFAAASEDAARRFIAAVDEFYDRRVNLVISAAAAPMQLYQSERLRFEFERTASRLIEMQSEEYLTSAHRS